MWLRLIVMGLALGFNCFTWLCEHGVICNGIRADKKSFRKVADIL